MKRRHGGAEALRLGIVNKVVVAGIAPPIISTTPNSPTVCAKLSAIPVTSPGLDSGKTTRQNVRHPDAPNVAEAASRRVSTIKGLRLGSRMPGSICRARAY